MKIQHGVRQPRYGEMQCVENKEAAKIFRTIDEEPALCEPFGWSHEYVDDGTRAEDLQIAKALWEMVSDVLPPRYALVVKLRYLDMTFEEIGDLMGVTRERIRQMVCKAERKIKHPTCLGTLPKPSFCKSLSKFKLPVYAWTVPLE